MRILLLLVLSLGLGVLAPVDAQAWKVWMQVDCTSWGPVLCAEAIDGTLMGIPPGEILPLEIHLDTEGESGLQLLSVGVLIDASQPLAYDPATSDASDYILYSPHVSKSQPVVYMVPSNDPPNPWPAPPIGFNQINVDFFEVSLNATRAASDDVTLALLAIEAMGPLSTGLESAIGLTASGPGNIIQILDPELGAIHPPLNILPGIVFVPEPGMGGLIVCALAAGSLGWHRMR